MCLSLVIYLKTGPFGVVPLPSRLPVAVCVYFVTVAVACGPRGVGPRLLGVLVSYPGQNWPVSWRCCLWRSSTYKGSQPRGPPRICSGFVACGGCELLTPSPWPSRARLAWRLRLLFLPYGPDFTPVTYTAILSTSDLLGSGPRGFLPQSKGKFISGKFTMQISNYDKFSLKHDKNFILFIENSPNIIKKSVFKKKSKKFHLFYKLLKINELHFCPYYHISVLLY